MTENEAIERLEQHKEWGFRCVNEAIDIAIQVLEEIQQYRAIGTVEECEEAVELQHAMKVKEVLLPNNRTGYECGNCGNEIEVDMFHGNYCHWCGQKLDWEEEQ